MALLDETLEEDIRSLKPQEKVKTGNDLLEYLIPKQQRTEIKAEVTTGAKKIGIKNPKAIPDNCSSSPPRYRKTKAKIVPATNAPRMASIPNAMDSPTNTNMSASDARIPSS